MKQSKKDYAGDHDTGMYMKSNDREAAQTAEIGKWKSCIDKGNLQPLLMRIADYFHVLPPEDQHDRRRLYAIFADWQYIVHKVLDENCISIYEYLNESPDNRSFETPLDNAGYLQWLISKEAEFLVNRIKGLNNDDIINDICRYIDANLETATRNSIAAAFYLTPNYLSRIFHEKKGMTLIRYIQLARMNLAKRLLLENQLGISTIAEKTGYPSFAHFSKEFKRMVGMTPSEYRLNSIS